MITIYCGAFENSYLKPDDFVTFTHRMGSTSVVGPPAGGARNPPPKMVQADLKFILLFLILFPTLKSPPYKSPHYV
jgi:hypothetical protein